MGEHSGRLLAAATAVAGSFSVVATVVLRAGRGATDRQEVATWLIAEPLVLAVLVFVVVRWSTPRAGTVSGCLAAAGSALWVQRFLTGELAPEAIAASALWLIPSLAMGTVAWYLRWASAERARAITMVRSEQRAQLAVGLHDYVAHDLSEIVARAQAGAAVLPVGDPRVAELLVQIEAAGVRALTSMDRTVRALRRDDDPLPVARGGIEDTRSWYAGSRRPATSTPSSSSG